MLVFSLWFMEVNVKANQSKPFFTFHFSLRVNRVSPLYHLSLILYPFTPLQYIQGSA